MSLGQLRRHVATVWTLGIECECESEPVRGYEKDASKKRIGLTDATVLPSITGRGGPDLRPILDILPMTCSRHYEPCMGRSGPMTCTKCT